MDILTELFCNFDDFCQSFARLSPGSLTNLYACFRRVLQDTIQPQEFERLMGEYQQAHLEKGAEAVFSIDGKTLKGTIVQGEVRGTHLLSIDVPDQGLVLL
ncbi:MAG: hypothetical protein ACUVTG_14780 [Candidatus Oleimicrobiaceae bacterium]